MAHAALSDAIERFSRLTNQGLRIGLTDRSLIDPADPTAPGNKKARIRSIQFGARKL